MTMIEMTDKGRKILVNSDHIIAIGPLSADEASSVHKSLVVTTGVADIRVDQTIEEIAVALGRR